ncbi:probable G-protein coupled receptor 139 [Rhincodon typus]|uniref:probable G-protein coupled receptor 139 n=1 Tax=Rhincodon typus TaxID=259920 RepID=UPI00202ED759|nr:probable G-protein coupled receptor 139 [Rhincodon typus]
MGSGQMKTRLVLVTLMLLVFTEMSQCLTMSKIENEQDSLTTENSQACQGEILIHCTVQTQSQSFISDRSHPLSQKMGKAVILLVKEIYYPILAAVALPANLVNIVILSRGNCGLSKCISVYMVAMAATDLLVIINNIIIYCIFSYHFPLSFLSLTPVCKVIIYMNAVAFDLFVWCVVSFTLDRFIVICCQKFKTKYCTERTAITIITTLTILISPKEIPILFAYEPQQIINQVQWGCRSRAAFFSSSPGIAFVWFYSAWVIWLPFTLLVLFNSLTIRRILVSNRTRTGLCQLRTKNLRDSEVENRRKSIILLFSVSISFILLWLTHSVNLGVTRLTDTNYYRGDRTSPAYIASKIGHFLLFLSCFQNPCIYAVTQSKFREEMKNMLKFPWRLLQSLVRIKG